MDNIQRIKDLKMQLAETNITVADLQWQLLVKENELDACFKRYEDLGEKFDECRKKE